MKNTLTTTQKTEVVLAKGKSLLGITAKILSASKALATATTHKDITIINNLIWENVVEPEDNNMTWYDAMKYAKNLRLGGYDDWRLPTINELAYIVEECGGINVCWADGDWEDKRDKNIANESYQRNYKEKDFISNLYWSSSTVVDDEYDAWFVRFNYGDDGWNDKSLSFYVRCVRDGQ